MKTFVFRFAAVLGAVAAVLTSCSTVVVKKPAGDEVPLNAYSLGSLEGSQSVRGKAVDGMLVLFSHGVPTPPVVAR